MIRHFIQRKNYDQLNKYDLMAFASARYLTKKLQPFLVNNLAQILPLLTVDQTFTVD